MTFATTTLPVRARRRNLRLNIPPISLAALTWAGAASGTTAQSWRIGTVLAARPLGVNPQGLLVLQIGALTVEARIAHGKEAVAIRGRGPANVPITVTLTGEISRDLPVVVLSRTTARTDADGTYSVTIGIVAGPPRGSTIVATVTSLPGITPGSARLQIDRPSPNVDSPLDADPQ